MTNHTTKAGQVNSKGSGMWGLVKWWHKAFQSTSKPAIICHLSRTERQYTEIASAHTGVNRRSKSQSKTRQEKKAMKREAIDDHCSSWMLSLTHRNREEASSPTQDTPLELRNLRSSHGFWDRTPSTLRHTEEQQNVRCWSQTTPPRESWDVTSGDLNGTETLTQTIDKEVGRRRNGDTAKGKTRKRKRRASGARGDAHALAEHRSCTIHTRRKREVREKRGLLGVGLSYTHKLVIWDKPRNYFDY